MQPPSPSRQQQFDVSLINLLESKMELDDASCDEIKFTLPGGSELQHSHQDHLSYIITYFTQEAANVMTNTSLTQPLYDPGQKEEAIS